MTAPTHVVIGMAATIALARINGLALSPVLILCAVVGSLAPDIDADGGSISRPGKIFRRFLPRGAADLLDEFTQVISKAINMVFGHRGPMHWPLIGILIYLTGLLRQNDYLLWFGWGYLWHILADAITVKGVPVLGPFRSEFYSFGSFRTGRSSELLVLIPAFLFVLVCGWPLLPENLRYWLLFYAEKLTG